MAPLRRMLLAAVVGFLAVELVVRALAPVLGPPLTFYNINTQAKVAQLSAMASRGERVDVAFVGNSTTREGVDIAAFEQASGASAYNAGLQSATTYIVRRFVDEELLPTVHPKLVVYGLTSGSYAAADDVQTRQYDKAPSTRRHPASWVKRTAERWLYLWRYRNDLRDPRTGSTLLHALKDRSTHEGAQARALREMTTHGDLPARSTAGIGPGAVTVTDDPSAEPEAVPAASRADVRMLARRVAASGGRLVLVNMPTTAVDPAFTASVAELGRRNGVEVLDLHGAITDLADFTDGVHLNALGAAHLSAVLADRLSSLLR